jgi:aminopeptidase N
MSTGTYREMAHLADERDQAFAELAALRVQYHDAIKSLLNQTDVAVTAMGERDAALATIGRVQAILNDGEPALIVARVRAALKSNPTKGGTK